ncbi:MAG: DNRLRE domain-containing protein [Lentisphaerales bacterium]|nr:DNRLRE domain-containing protein [Lentisphaerales bacterium]
MTEKEEEQLYLWIEKQKDDCLSNDEAKALEELILNDEEARSLYMDLTTFDAMLFEKGIEPSEDLKQNNSIIYYKVALFAVAALLVLTFIFPKQIQPQAKSIATLVKTEECIWTNSSLPTSAGSNLTSGGFNLVEGLATVKFTSGVEMIIEAPAEIELIDAMNCLVKHGTVMVEVPEGAQGFTIDTPKAKAIDHGTKFVVSYNKKSEKSLVEVIDGEVEVKANAESEGKRFFAGKSAMVSDNKLRSIEIQQELNLGAYNKEKPEKRLRISTAVGRGMDQAIDFSKKTKNKHVSLLTVKNALNELKRKSYMKFDIAGLKTHFVKNVKLKLNFIPTGFGNTYHLPETATFEVYGLTDENQDNWIESLLTWENAPANEDQSDKLDFSKAVKVGEFSFNRSVQRKTVMINGADLHDFIMADSNDLVTFIVIRTSKEHHRDGYVHAFASKEHPINLPPTLVFELEE